MYEQFDEHSGFKVGQRVYLRVTSTGDTDDDDEVMYPVGSPGKIWGICMYPAPQNIAFTVSIGEITNVFDEADGLIGDFLSALPLETKTFLVQASDDPSGDNCDFLVHAKSPEEAMALWREEEFVCNLGFEGHVRIFEVPQPEGFSKLLNWGTVTGPHIRYSTNILREH